MKKKIVAIVLAIVVVGVATPIASAGFGAKAPSSHSPSGFWEGPGSVTPKGAWGSKALHPLGWTWDRVKSL